MNVTSQQLAATSYIYLHSVISVGGGSLSVVGLEVRFMLFEVDFFYHAPNRLFVIFLHAVMYVVHTSREEILASS